MRHLLYICGLSILIAACETQLPVPPGRMPPKTVLYSELTAGKPVEVRIGKSKTVRPGVDNQFEQVPNAVVELLNQDGGLMETLQYVNNPENQMSVYRGNIKPAPLRTYRIKANVPGMPELTAAAWIPAPFRVTLLDTVRTVLNGRNVLRFHYNIMPQPATIRQYVVMEALKQAAYADTLFNYNGVKYSKKDNAELYEQERQKPNFRFWKDTVYLDFYLRIPCYTQDENADNNQIGGLNENYNAILFTQAGRPLDTYFYLNATALTAGLAEEILPKGRVMVYVKTVSKEYYDFLLTYEKIKRNPGLNSLVQAIQLKSNTKNGLGILGGSFERMYYMYFDDL